MEKLITTFESIPRIKSLSFQLLVGMLVWLLCAIVFTGYTLLLSWELENGGVAINDAGSLRKRTYQIALLHNQSGDNGELKAEQVQFEQVLMNLKQVGQGKSLLPDNEDISAQVQLVDTQWRSQILPWYAQLAQTHQTINADNHQILDDFAATINHLVKLIEDDNTHNIQLLRLFQMLLILMTFVTAMTGIYLLTRLVIRPLEGLRIGIVRLTAGDLKVRVNVHQSNEFGLVAKGFNQMAGSLEYIYANLEQKIADKTHALGEKNLELSSLYAVTAYLHEIHTTVETGRGFIERVLALSGAQAGSIRLIESENKQLTYLASVGLDETTQDALRSHSSTSCACGGLALNQIVTFYPWQSGAQSATLCCKAGFAKVIQFPVRFYAQEVGVFSLYFKKDVFIDSSTQKLIEILCNQLGVAIENHRLIARDTQFAVVEERNLMAQGLHDSIAQSLSFLNLQVQMLEDALKNNRAADAQENLAFIKDGVQESYEDVRELLLNFRTRLHKQDFADAAKTVLQRFEQQARIETRLTVEGGESWLSPQQQLQVIFILQEALSNVRKHAHAQLVHVDINHNVDNTGDFSLEVKDDGTGFNAEDLIYKRMNHVGTAIMQERAQQVHGTISIQSHAGQGTLVKLQLPSKEHLLL